MALRKLLVLLIVLPMAGCATVEYKALEKVGIQKRDILVHRIEKAKEAQQDTKAQVVSAYQRLKELVSVDDGGLEARYKKMAKAVARSEKQVRELDDRIAAVDKVAGDLFQEWEDELSLYSNPNLRDASARNLRTTKARYAVLIRRMRSARARIDPVLYVLQDQTLYLKHNLNARAVSSLQGEVTRIQDKVAALVSEMERSINEAEQFVNDVKTRR